MELASRPGFFTLAAPAGRLALRAMLAVAAADGEVTEDERRWLEAAAAGLGVDVGLLEEGPITPAQLAAGAAELDEVTRRRIVQALILIALVDEKIDDREATTVRAFSDALGIEERRVHNLAQLARGRILVTWLDLARRSFAKKVFLDALEQRGPKGVWRIVGPMLGRADDAELARRYNALGELPEGTFGRAYWRFIVDHELGFPGEHGAVAEVGLWHDVSHVISGLGTTPAEEVEVVSFIAGFQREDPFFWLFTIAMQFHLGLRVSPYSQSARGLFEPEAVLRSFERGAALSTDLQHWDPWPHFGRPLSDVRRELGLPVA